MNNRLTISKKRAASLWFTLFIILCFIRVIKGDSVSFVFNGALIAFCGRLLLCSRWQLPPKGLLFFVVYAVVISMVAALQWGVNSLLLNYVIGFVVILTLFCTLGREYSEELWLVAYGRAAIFLLIISYISILLQIDEVKYFFQNTSWMVHPAIYTFTGGGVNIDATWLAILGIALIKTKGKWFYWGLSIFYAAVVASRVGILTNLLCMVVYLANDTDRVKGMLKKSVPIVLGIFALSLIFASGSFEFVLERFSQIGDESGSIGRLMMWRNIPTLIKTYPFGVGVGNVMDALQTVANMRYEESNIHCIPLQWLCELGLPGVCFYVWFVVWFLKRENKKVFTKPFSAMLLAYIIVSLIQFRGGEAMLFCMMGTYFSVENQRCGNNI